MDGDPGRPDTDVRHQYFNRPNPPLLRDETFTGFARAPTLKRPGEGAFLQNPGSRSGRRRVISGPGLSTPRPKYAPRTRAANLHAFRRRCLPPCAMPATRSPGAPMAPTMVMFVPRPDGYPGVQQFPLSLAPVPQLLDLQKYLMPDDVPPPEIRDLRRGEGSARQLCARWSGGH